MPFGGAGADQVEAVLGQAGDGELADHAALGVERVAEADPADLGQARAEQPVEHGRGARALQHELGEAAEVDHAHGLAHGPDLGGDQTRSSCGRGAELSVGSSTVPAGSKNAARSQPLRAAKRAPLACEHGIERRRARGPPGRALLEREADRIFVLVELDRLGGRVGGGGVAGVAARVEHPAVPFRGTVDHPLAEELAGPARLGDAEAEAAALVEVGQPVRRADVGVAVGRVGDRAVDHALDAALGQDRHARAGVLDVALQPAQIVGPELVGEVGRDAVLPFGAALPLVGAEDEALPLLAQIVGDVGVAQQRQLLAAALDQGRDVLGDQILVLHGDDRQVPAEQRHDLAGPVAGGVDHDLGADRLALVGADQPLAGAAAGEAGDPGEAVDPAAGLAGEPRIGLGQLRRVDVAVHRVPERTLEVVRLQERVELARLRRGQRGRRRAPAPGPWPGRGGTRPSARDGGRGASSRCRDSRCRPRARPRGAGRASPHRPASSSPSTTRRRSGSCRRRARSSRR